LAYDLKPKITAVGITFDLRKKFNKEVQGSRIHSKAQDNLIKRLGKKIFLALRLIQEFFRITNSLKSKNNII